MREEERQRKREEREQREESGRERIRDPETHTQGIASHNQPATSSHTRRHAATRSHTQPHLPHAATHLIRGDGPAHDLVEDSLLARVLRWKEESGVTRVRNGGDGEKEGGRSMMEGPQERTEGDLGRLGGWQRAHLEVWRRVKATAFVRGGSGKEPLAVAPGRDTHLPVLCRPLT